MWLGFSAVAGLQRLSHSDSHPSRDCSPRIEHLSLLPETLNTHGYLGQKICVDANREILTFLFEHQHRIDEDKLSLRMFCKAQELYVAMPDSWRDYVEDMLLTPRLKGP